MEDEIKDEAHISTEQEEADLDTAHDESVDEVKARLAKAEELANNYKIRAEKAERLAKNVKEVTTPKLSPKTDVSTQDLYALFEAKVPQEDIEDVKEYANLKNISLAEALKSNVVKTILSEKLEMRNVAQASNVGITRRASGKVSDETLISKASSGELPESDDELMRLIKARKGIK